MAIANFAYSPSSLTVGKGTKVTWTNDDSAPHTVTSDGSGPLHSPSLDRGGSFSYTFDSAGTFSYYCTVHPNMHGTVVVK
ncbi:cupredoxin family copper-binding protein [Streptomyces morookaense]|uniref:cupredoxin domain-containing protein n=1 Tax=Streptomyces morookaense TaxID=1970 RepID=UPI0033E8E09E